MIELADTENLKKIDPQNTLASTEQLTKQLRTAWEEVHQLPLRADYGDVTNIVFCGMGASAYGALVIRSLMGPSMPVPSEVITDYQIPNYVDQNSLVVLTSYSGSTEEVLACAQDALAKNAKMLIITKGGKLAEMAKKHNIPAYIFDGKLNPAGVPRLGNGYTILGLMGLLNRTNVIATEEREIADAITRLEEKMPDLKKRAMEDARTLVDAIPVVFVAEHLTGNGQILRNQFNETSKTFSAHYMVPDLNHHLMEGLQFPKESKLHIIMITSQNYAPKIQRRMTLTKEVVEKNNLPYYTFETSGQTFYDDFLEVLAYGSFLTFYVGILHEQNPAINPWVDYFKDQLTKA